MTRRGVMRVFWWSFGVALALAGVYAVLRLTVYDVIRFRKSEDMWPTIGPGAVVMVNRLATPRRGDLVVIDTKDGERIVRRVVGLPGETLAIIDSRPFIDGFEVRWEEQWRWKDGARTLAVNREYLGGKSWLVVDDHNRRMSNLYAKEIVGGYYVLADHREHVLGRDSRDFGPVPREKIRGVVSFVLKRGTLPEAQWLLDPDGGVR